MEQLTRGRFHQNGVTYENVASPNGIVKEVSKADGYTTVDGEKIYPKVMQAESKIIYSTTGDLPEGTEGVIFFVRGSNGVVAYQYQTDEWVAIKHMVDGDLISAEGILYEYTNGAFNETATATSVGAVPSNSETPTYTSYIKNDNSKIELYQLVNNGVSGYTQPNNRIVVDQNGVITTSEEGHSNFADYSQSILTSFDGEVRYKKSQFNYVEGEFRHEEEVLKNGEIATASTIAEYTLAVANWSSNQYTLSVTGKNSSNHALVSNSNSGATDADVLANAQAISDANIYRIIDNGDTLTLVCENTPSTDLKIQVEVFD